MHACKGAIEDPKTGKPTRVRFDTDKARKKIRVAVKSGETING